MNSLKIKNGTRKIRDVIYVTSYKIFRWHWRYLNVTSWPNKMKNLPGRMTLRDDADIRGEALWDNGILGWWSSITSRSHQDIHAVVRNSAKDKNESQSCSQRKDNDDSNECSKRQWPIRNITRAAPVDQQYLNRLTKQAHWANTTNRNSKREQKHGRKQDTETRG